MKKVVPVLVCVAAVIGSPLASAADKQPLMVDGDAAAGKKMSSTCAGCHGAKGNSPKGEWPNLGGQHAGYLYKQLKNYKSGERENSVMSGMAASLSKQDMRDLAAYYASQPQKTMGASDEDLVARGQEIFLGGVPPKNVASCAGCHGPAGRGNPAANYPDIGGQWAKYVKTQLEYFRSGKRDNDADAVMRTLAERLSDEDIRAVSAYLAGLH